MDHEGLFVGDRVEFMVTEALATGAIKGTRGVITGVLPRESVLKRPYIANVELLVLVFAHQKPDPNEKLITRFLVLAEASGIPYLLVFNKSDLVSKGKAIYLANIYRKYGYPVLCASAISHLGKRSLLRLMKGKVTVFAGPSGAGKSALINLIAPGFKLETGNVSEKIGRGKHTTREVTLLKINPASYVADTPGFSQLTLDFLKPWELANCFPDFKVYQDLCRFKSCNHQNEPGCAIRNAVAAGEIGATRYESYLELLAEVKALWENRYR
ncbi:MAG: ribosome small subunit-dependent GTPase A [Firmicutes bacterium]|nr:ribosome small subunit-dependent GTPase A [Bacillota bacterium]